MLLKIHPCLPQQPRNISPRKMQVKSFSIFPTNLISSLNLRPLHQTPLHAKFIKSISIFTPNNTPFSSNKKHSALDNQDSATAFQDYQVLFMSQRSETFEPITLNVVDGEIPADFPSGTYYLAGPGIFTDDYGSRVHPLDGHGYLRAFTFDMDTKEVKFKAKYIKTEAQLEEHNTADNTWRFKYRGPFSVLKGGKKMCNTKVMKNVANTSVLYWGGKLLCFWEGGEPYEIKPGTLDTIGKFNVIDCFDYSQDGKISEGNKWDIASKILKPILSGIFRMPRRRLLSHYKIDPSRNRLLIMACNSEDMLLPHSHFTIYEFDHEFRELQKQEFNIPDHLMIHDWAFTDTHYILFSNRVKLDLLGSLAALSGLSPMISTLSTNSSKPVSPVYLLPRFPDKDVGNRDWRVPIEVPSQLWLLHFANAFENKDECGNTIIQIYASACSYQWFNFHKLFGYNWHNNDLDPSIMNAKEDHKKIPPRLIQVSINLDVKGKCQRCNMKSLNYWRKPSDFLAINPIFSSKKNSLIYGATTSGSRSTLPHFPFDTVVKLNVSSGSTNSWCAKSRRFLGEPIFVPKGEQEKNGYIILIEYAVSIQRCFLVVLDSERIGEADALLTRLEVPKHLSFPLGFHGFWATN